MRPLKFLFADRSFDDLGMQRSECRTSNMQEEKQAMGLPCFIARLVALDVLLSTTNQLIATKVVLTPCETFPTSTADDNTVRA